MNNLQVTFFILITMPLVIAAYYIIIKDFIDDHFPTTNTVNWDKVSMTARNQVVE